MSLQVRRLSSVEAANENQWNHVVTQSEFSSVFHRYEWVRAAEAISSDEHCHLLVEKKGNPIAILPGMIRQIQPFPVRRLYSLRPGSVGPAILSDEEAAMEHILEAIPKVCDRTTVIHQFSGLPSAFIRYHDIFTENNYALTVRDCHTILDLTKGWDALLAEMDSSRRRAIKNGNDQDYEIRDEPLTVDTITEFYEALEIVMDRVGGSAISESFYQELRHFPERVKLYSLHTDGGRNGMILYVLDDERSMIHYFRSGVTEEHFRYNASELLHEHVIKWGIENGYERFNFRGSDPDFRDGIYRFKEKFGGDVVPTLTWERGCPRPALPALNATRYAFESYNGFRSQ